MKMLIFVALFIFAYYFHVSGYNLDTNAPIIYFDPYLFKLASKTLKSSYFGYSVAMLGARETRDGPWLQVGAPRSVSPGSSVQNPGLVFRCDIGQPCLILNVDKDNSSSSSYRERYIDKKDNSWLGGVMDIDDYKNRHVICAPRWINHYSKRPFTTNHEYLMQGSCYWSHLNSSNMERLLPLVNKEYKYVRDRGAYNYGEGQAGFSVHFTKSKKQSELLIGAPGVYNWKGIPLIYRDCEYEEPQSSKLIHARSTTLKFSDLNIGNAAETIEVGAFGYLGYSVTSGYFFSKNEIMYVAGAPRSKHYKGQILIFKFAEASNRALLVEKSKQGYQLGEYFGASLASGDINNDGFDDLFVGAPFHSSSKYNEGRIYVFLGDGRGELKTPSSGNAIDGKGVGGQFGTSLMFLSDLDLDGFPDLAVGAPYEETSGVLYIFSGTSDGLLQKPSQRIVGKNLYFNIRGFGISISKPVDIDNNQYHDIAVGAHLSGQVVILRGRPTVTVEHMLIPDMPYIDFFAKSFIVRACYVYKGQFLPPTLNITRILTADDLLHRAVLSKNFTVMKSLILKAEKRTCENITLDIKKIDNIYDPITVKLVHEFVDENKGNSAVLIKKDVTGTDLFCSTCPVYNKVKSSKAQLLNIPIALGCKDKNICYSKLFVEVGFKNIGQENGFVIGSAEHVAMKVKVWNKGEKAYMTQLKITLPNAVNFGSIPSFCTEQNVTLLCDVDNPLMENSQRSFILDLDMKAVNSGKCTKTFLNFTVTALTRSTNLNNKTVSAVLKLVHQADVTITGKSDKQSCFYGNRKFGVATFTHTYQIEKIGSSPLDELKINITVPHAIRGSGSSFLSLFPPEAYLNGQPIVCKTNMTVIVDGEPSVFSKNISRVRRFVKADANSIWKSSLQEEFNYLVNRTFYANCSTKNIICSSVVCLAGPFNKRQNNAIVQMKMMFNVSSVSGILKENTIFSLATDAAVEIIEPADYEQSGNRSDTVQILTLFVGETENIQIKLWIIIASAIAGLILLLLLTIALVRAGFFKRTKKIELEALKEAEAESDFTYDQGEKFQETDEIFSDIDACNR